MYAIRSPEPVDIHSLEYQEKYREYLYYKHRLIEVIRSPYITASFQNIYNDNTWNKFSPRKFSFTNKVYGYLYRIHNTDFGLWVNICHSITTRVYNFGNNSAVSWSSFLNAKKAFSKEKAIRLAYKDFYVEEITANIVYYPFSKEWRMLGEITAIDNREFTDRDVSGLNPISNYKCFMYNRPFILTNKFATHDLDVYISDNRHKNLNRLNPISGTKRYSITDILDKITIDEASELVFDLDFWGNLNDRR